MSNKYNFTIDQGSTFLKEIIWKNDNGTVKNLTSYTARMQLRTAYASDVVVEELNTGNGGIVITPSEGKIVLNMTATETSLLKGSYVYDLEMINGATVTRLIQGDIAISPEVTR